MMADDEASDMHADTPPPRARLPDLALPTLVGDTTVPLRARRMGTVLVLLAAGAETTLRDADAAWLRLLAANGDALRGWDGRVIVVLDGAPGARVPKLPLSLDAVTDQQRAVTRAAGIDAPALVIADQWGEVHAAMSARDAWPALDEVVSWLRYMAIRGAG